MSKPLFAIPEPTWWCDDLPLFEALRDLPAGFALGVAGRTVIIEPTPPKELDQAG